MRLIWLQLRAAAHMGHGSTVTYKVQSCRYLPLQILAPEGLGCRRYRNHLCMSRSVVQTLDHIVPLSDYTPFADNHRPYGNLLLQSRRLRLGKGLSHEFFVLFHIAGNLARFL